MKLTIKNKLVSFGGSSTVKDETGNDVYFVKGKPFSLTKKKKLRTLDKKLLYKIRNKFWHNPHTYSAYIYDAHGDKVAILKEKFNWNLTKVTYEVKGADQEILIEGTAFTGKLDIKYGDKLIGTIQPPALENVKDFLRLSDCYVLDAYDNEDAAFLAAIVIARDNIIDRHRKHNK